MDLHGNFLLREQIIAGYLSRKLDANAADDFEAHYLFCEECFEELRATQLLMAGLGGNVIDRTRKQDVTVLRFARQAQLTAASSDLVALVENMNHPSDTKVLIDLSRVSRIDSTGLGMLMKCYAHAVRNDGALKLLNPNATIKRVLEITKIDSVIQAHDDEESALGSFMN